MALFFCRPQLMNARTSIRTCFAALLCVLWLAGRAAAQAPAPPSVPPPDPVDATAVIFATSGAASQIAVSYAREATDAQVQQDFAAMAAELHKPPPRVQIDRRPLRTGLQPTTTGTASLPGLVEWGQGVVHLDPILAGLKRFRRFTVTYVFFERFNLTAPLGEQRQGPLHWRSQVQGQSVTYDVWIDQSGGEPGRLPGTGPGGVTWVLIAAVATGVLGLTALLFYAVYRLTHQR